MEKVGCLFCGNKHETVFREESGYFTRKCPECGLVYLSPRPTESEMQVLYESGRAGGLSADEQIKPSVTRELGARYALSILRKYKPGGDLLEIGAGAGAFLAAAREAGYTPYAVEINGRLAKHLSETLAIETAHAPAGGEFFRGRTFDVIYHRDVLSHLHSPIETHRRLAEKLAGDGVLLFETGNVGDLSARWLSFAGRLSLPEHVYLFSRSNVERLLDEAGFRAVEIRYHTTVLSLAAERAAAFVKRAFGARSHGTATDEGAKPAAHLRTEGSAAGGLRQTPRQPWHKAAAGYAGYAIEYPLARFFPRSWPSRVIYVARKK